jgi:glycosyltransferase involved in cell wall biosynthesis
MAFPLVTLAMPVRNGASMLRAALDGMVGQDYPNIEIIVSDNNSDDETSAILESYRALHPNMTVHRRTATVSVITNMLSLVDAAHGEFFSWCAHDDVKSPDFVTKTLAPLIASRTCVLASGDVFSWADQIGNAERQAFAFETVGRSTTSRMSTTSSLKMYHFYGLWRRDTLRKIVSSYRYTHWWADMPLMLAAAALGEFTYVAGPSLTYYEPIKTALERAAYQDNRNQVSPVFDVLDLVRATYLTVSATTNSPRLGLVAAAFVIRKFGVQAFHKALRTGPYRKQAG